MLDPQNRQQLLDALRPPAGYTLDCGIGTTFSLDLLALLFAPLAFTLFDWQDNAGNTSPDPVVLLEALRRSADKISLFCQAGQIHIPNGTDQRLCTYLEDSVIEVTAQHPKGVFHPKVWALRFTAPELATRYRLLCLSRNLTFDRCWDTILVLEGDVKERVNGFGMNRSLGEFIKVLPTLVIHPVPSHTQEHINLIHEEIRRVEFAAPGIFEEVTGFWPLGLKGLPRWPFEGRIDRMLIVSPFLSDVFFDRLSCKPAKTLLVSRVESLDSLPSSRTTPLAGVYQMSQQAEPELGDDEVNVSDEESLVGLHAKLYVADSGSKSRVWTGSANATSAAFAQNVEFLVELQGSQSKKDLCNIAGMMGRIDGNTSFRDLLQEYSPPTIQVEVDAARLMLEQTAEQLRRQVIILGLRATVEQADTESTYRIRLSSQESFISLPEGCSIMSWPITLPEQRAVSFTTDETGNIEMCFQAISMEGLTAFYAFVVAATDGVCVERKRFVLKLPLEGAPDDRRDRILRALLQNREQVLRYLLLLLSEGGGDIAGIWQGLQKLAGGVQGDQHPDIVSLPLFEYLVRAVTSDPDKLKQVHNLVRDLCEQPDGYALLPEGFLSIWEPIQLARERMGT